MTQTITHSRHSALLLIIYSNVHWGTENLPTKFAMAYFEVLLIVCACIMGSESKLCENLDTLQGILQRLEMLETENEMLKKQIEGNEKRNYYLTKKIESLEKRVSFVYKKNKETTADDKQWTIYEANYSDAKLQNSALLEKYERGVSSFNNQRRKRISKTYFLIFYEKVNFNVA